MRMQRGALLGKALADRLQRGSKPQLGPIERPRDPERLRGEQRSGDQKEEDRRAWNERQNDAYGEGHHACRCIENASDGRFSGFGLPVLAMVRLEPLSRLEPLERVPMIFELRQH